jgi:hypothetical protein
MSCRAKLAAAAISGLNHRQKVQKMEIIIFGLFWTLHFSGLFCIFWTELSELTGLSGLFRTFYKTFLDLLDFLDWIQPTLRRSPRSPATRRTPAEAATTSLAKYSILRWKKTSGIKSKRDRAKKFSLHFLDETELYKNAFLVVQYLPKTGFSGNLKRTLPKLVERSILHHKRGVCSWGKIC